MAFHEPKPAENTLAGLILADRLGVTVQGNHQYGTTTATAVRKQFLHAAPQVTPARSCRKLGHTL